MKMYGNADLISFPVKVTHHYGTIETEISKKGGAPYATTDFH